MLKCREVAYLVASGEIAELGWMKRLEVRLHWLFCKNCRLYAEQMARLGEVARRAWGPGTTDPAIIDRLERKILAANAGA